MDDLIIPAKKTVKKRKSLKASPAADVFNENMKTLPPADSLSSVISYLSDLINKINEAKVEIENLHKIIYETKQSWEKEKDEHRMEITQRDTAENVQRKREEEEYEYQKRMERKKSEDEFAERKTKWEKELADRKEEINADKHELNELRTKVAAFETEISKAVKNAQADLTRELTSGYANERKLREQEVKSDKELLALRLTNLTADNTRLADEVEMLRKALNIANQEVKDIAVKVIEGRTPSTDSQIKLALDK